MKKRVVSTLLLIGMLIGTLDANATESEEPELKLMNCTAYTGGTVTSTGKTPRVGLCATDPDHVGDGWVAIVYRACPTEDGYEVGERLYILECEDTGGWAVNNGYTLDVWRENLKDCQYVMETVYDFGSNGKVFVQYVKGVG